MIGKTRVRPVCCAYVLYAIGPHLPLYRTHTVPWTAERWSMVQLWAGSWAFQGIWYAQCRILHAHDLVGSEACQGRCWMLVASGGLLRASCMELYGASTYVYGKQDQRWPSEDELLNELSPTIKINKESHIHGWGASLRGILLGWFLSLVPQWLVPGAGKGLAAGPGPFIFHGLRGVAQQPDHVQC